MRKWSKLCQGPGGDQAQWRLFHESTKSGRTDRLLPAAVVRQRMEVFAPSLSYDTTPSYPLTNPAKLASEPIWGARISAADFSAGWLSLDQLATVLMHGYGYHHGGRSHRPIPSAGGLYPLEVFVIAARVRQLPRAIYHYQPFQNKLEWVTALTFGWEGIFVQPDVVSRAAAILIIAAAFERSAMKYGEKGYRFCLIEAGHVGQSIVLCASAISLVSLPIAGYYDRELDALLTLDGISQSVVYSVAIGPHAGSADGC